MPPLLVALKVEAEGLFTSQKCYPVFPRHPHRCRASCPCCVSVWVLYTLNDRRFIGTSSLYVCTSQGSHGAWSRPEEATSPLMLSASPGEMLGGRMQSGCAVAARDLSPDSLLLPSKRGRKELLPAGARKQISVRMFATILHNKQSSDFLAFSLLLGHSPSQSLASHDERKWTAGTVH